MKMHLRRPAELNSMCGLSHNSDYLIYDAREVDCKHCLKFYKGNEAWYKRQLLNAFLKSWNDAVHETAKALNTLFKEVKEAMDEAGRAISPPTEGSG